MANVEKVLKGEITRIAQLEAKRLLRKETGKLKGDIGRLKEKIKQLEIRVAALGDVQMKNTAEKKVQKILAKPIDKLNIRMSPKLIKTVRKKLGLNAEQLAQLVSVSPATIYNWEAGKTKPSEPQKKKLAALRPLGKREVEKLL